MRGGNFFNKVLFIIISYAVLALAVYGSLWLFSKNIDKFLISLILPAALLIVIYLISTIRKIEAPTSPIEKTTRYTMHCLKCGWEWMSHTTEKAPNQCPNCHEKERLEVIGWRRINIPKKKSDIDLRKYFR